MFPTEPTYVHCQHRVSPTWTLTLTLATAPTSADSLQARLQAAEEKEQQVREEFEQQDGEKGRLQKQLA